MLTRSSLKILVLAFLAFACFCQPATDSSPIQILVGPGKEVTVTIPNIKRENLESILSTFFGREKPEATKKMHAALDQASEITIILTSKRER